MLEVEGQGQVAGGRIWGVGEDDEAARPENQLAQAGGTAGSGSHRPWNSGLTSRHFRL